MYFWRKSPHCSRLPGLINSLDGGRFPRAHGQRGSGENTPTRRLADGKARIAGCGTVRRKRKNLLPCCGPPAAAPREAHPERHSRSDRKKLEIEMTIENQNSDELLGKIRGAFKSAFDIDPKTITLNTVPGDISAWDSMGHVTLASSLEQTFGMTFDVDDLMAMENVKEIYRVVQSKLGQVQSA
jgi:acyl carrier protein